MGHSVCGLSDFVSCPNETTLSLSFSLSYVVLILPNSRITTINTFNLLTSSVCETHSKSLPKKMARRLFFFFFDIWQEDFVSCLNEVSN